MQVQRDSTKKKKEEIKDSYPVSGYNWALSSCSDATDSETEQCTRKKSNVKRKRKENDATETPQMRREMFCKRTSAQRSSSLRDQEESVDCDEELTGMQALLEMQLKVSARCLRLNWLTLPPVFMITCVCTHFQMVPCCSFLHMY